MPDGQTTDWFSQNAPPQASAPKSGDWFASNAPAAKMQTSTSTDETGVWAGVKRNTIGMVQGIYHAFTQPATDEEKQQLLQKVKEAKAAGDDVPESLATNPSRATLAYHRLIDAPADYLQAKGSNERAAARDLMRHGEIWKGANTYLSGLADTGLSAVPLAGPAINNIAERFERGDHSGAATDLAFALGAEQLAGKPKGAPEVTPASRLSEQITHARQMDITRAGGTPPEPTPSSGLLADLLRTSAQKSYEDVLNPTKQATKYQTQKIMPKLLEERPIAMTRKGLAEKAAGRAEQAGQQIEQTVSGLQGTMNTQPVIDGLQNLKKNFQVNGVSLRPEVDNAIDAVSEQMQAMGSDISLQDAVKARRILDQAVAEAKGYQGAQLSDASMAAIRRETANSIRSELASASPDLAAVNAKFHFWNTLNDVIEQTVQRKTGQVNALPKVETAIAGAGGLARGGLTGAAAYAAAINLLGKAFRSTGWRTVSAATKLGIADALASGNFGRASELLGQTGLTGLAASKAAEQQGNSKRLSELLETTQ